MPALARTDATIIAAPTSTKNKEKARDPEMHQTKKGNQWHFGMMVHIGVDVASGVVHSLIGTAANAADITRMAAVLHGEQKAEFADAGYSGAAKRPEHAGGAVSWNIAVKRGIIKALPTALRALAEPEERALAQVRGPEPAPAKAGVERPFHIVKNRFRDVETGAQIGDRVTIKNQAVVWEGVRNRRRCLHRAWNLLYQQPHSARPALVIYGNWTSLWAKGASGWRQYA